jgi:hypothetical protein
MSKEKVMLEAIEEPVIKPIEDTKEAHPVTVYDIVMANMTIDKLADLGVKLISVNNCELYWVTSAGQLYTFGARPQALAAERAWLSSEAH